MTMTTKKIYKIDDKPVSPHELIAAACEADKPFSVLFMKTTSRAATILRKYGHTVTTNNEVQ